MRGEIREKSGSFVGDSRENGVFWRNLRKNGEIWGKLARVRERGGGALPPKYLLLARGRGANGGRGGLPYDTVSIGCQPKR